MKGQVISRNGVTQQLRREKKFIWSHEDMTSHEFDVCLLT